MLSLAFLSALALTADKVDPWACDLAPSFGQGTSDEGDIDSITILSFSCRYEVVNIGGVGISPHIGLDKQMWSVYERNTGSKNISSYDTQDLLYGLRLDYRTSERVKVFYSFASGKGHGSLERTESTASSTLSGSYDGLEQSLLSHTLGAAYALTERMDVTFAWQRLDASQKWSVKADDIFAQSVGDDNALTLTNGESANLVGREFRNSNQSSTNSLQIGISLSFGG